MKRKKYLYIIVLLIIGLSSCKKDFLNVPDDSVILQQEYVKDLKTTDDYLNGVYFLLAQNFYQGYYIIYPDLIADNIKLATSGATNLSAQYNWSQTQDLNSPSPTNMNGVWLYGYQIIRACNFVLEKSEEFKNQDPARADNMKGQALTIRALVHFVLVNTFGQAYNYTGDASHTGIPIITTSDYTQPVVGRNSVQEVYENIINDLKVAEPLFDIKKANVLLMNQNATKALLARVSLFKNDFVSAKNYAREVINKVPAMSAANYPDKMYTLQETEALFQLPPGVNNNSSNFAGNYFTSNYSLQFLATTDIVNIIRENATDKRNLWVTQVSGAWRINKFTDSVVSTVTPQAGSYYQTILRSSEMYLTAAEAYANLKNEDSARYYLDVIKARAIPNAIPTTAIGGALLDSIYKERRKEMAFEGLRMFDLLRWKKGVSRSDAWNPTAQNLAYPNNKAIAPIPGRDVSSFGLSQNLSY